MFFKILIQLIIFNKLLLVNFIKKFQQLAGLLIARQVIGNFRESAWPYLMEQWRLAKLSFKIWGALSPTAEKSETKFDDTTSEKPTTPLRSIGQAELESSLYKVRMMSIVYNIFLNISTY